MSAPVLLLDHYQQAIGRTFTCVRLLTGFRTAILLAVAIFSLSLLEALQPVRYAEAQTPPKIDGVAVTSDPGEDGGYGLNSAIEVELTFSEGVTATGTPQLTLDVGGQQRTAGYSGAGASTGELLFTYTVAEGDEDTDGIAVVANSLVLNGGTIRGTQNSVDASLTHSVLQAADHKVDGIAPTVTVGGETRTYVHPDREFNVVFTFSEPVFGFADDDVIVTNGSVSSTYRATATTEQPENTRWVAVIQPTAEGPVSVDLRAGAGTDAVGNGSAASSGALSVIAADPVTVEVIQATSGFAEGGDATFRLSRSRDNGEMALSLTVEQVGEFMSGTAVVAHSLTETTTVPLTFNGATASLEVSWSVGQQTKFVSFPTVDDALDEPDGTITLSVAANPAQYQYIPGSQSSVVSRVRDNDEPWAVFLAPDHTVRASLVEGEIAVFRLSHVERRQSPVSVVFLEFTAGLDLLDLDGAGASGYTHLGGGRISVDLSPRYVTRFYVPTVANETIGTGGSITLQGRSGPGYVFNQRWMEWTYLLEDDDTPSGITLDAPASVTEGDEVHYTVTRTQGTGESRAALTVNVRLQQTGDYITWPAGYMPDAEGRYTIPVTFAASSSVATLTLTTSDDDVTEVNGTLSASLLASSNSKYAVVTTAAQNTVLRDNELSQVSVAVVAGRVTEGEDVQFRFTRFGDDSTAVRAGLWVGGLAKIMTDATEATALTADNADLTQRLSIHGAYVDYILEFAIGETEKTIAFTTEADNVNEGDGWIGVTIVQRAGNPFAIGAGYAQVHVDDDDIPTVSFSQVTLPTGAATLEGDTWMGDLGERQELSWVVSCSGNYEYSPISRSFNGVRVQTEHLRLANHPAYYHHEIALRLGNNELGFLSGGICDGQARSYHGNHRFVGPDGGVETFKLVPRDRNPPIIAQYREAYRLAKAAADTAGTLITQHDIIHPVSILLPHDLLFFCGSEPQYCPQYRVGTPHTIKLTLVNRNPTILIKAESTTVAEGEPARFIVQRLWHDDVLRLAGSLSETVVALRASQNGQFITGALPTEITFGQNETSKTIELATVDDSAFSANGSVTIELLPDTTGADLNISGKYETSEQWSGHTPEGGRSDQATVTITNNDTKPSITIAPASAVEGDSGSTNMTFTITLSAAVTGALTVNYATSDGTATAGQDYTAVSNSSVTIAAGNTTARFTVSVTGDETDEFDETFNVTISLTAGETEAAILGGDSATVTGTIVDDDLVQVSIAAKAATVEEGEDAVFILTRTGDASEELSVTFFYRGDGAQERLNATFAPGSSTTEASRTTVDDALVNYPADRPYEAVLLGDSLGESNVENRVWATGTPASATVTVTDNDVLATVTVHAQQAFATERGPIRAIFRRTGGNITLPLTVDYVQLFLRNDAETHFGASQQITFPANQAEVTSSDFTAGALPGDSIINTVPNSGDLYVPWTLTTVIYGDGGPNGFHRSWEAGIPNTASTVLYDDDVTQGLGVHAQYSHSAARGDQVTITFTVMNTGTVTTGTPITITSVQRDDNDSDLDGQSESRVGCTITSAISVRASASCTATFTIGQTDFENTPLELDATASDSTATSKPFRIYITILDGVLVGFRETDALQITEGASAVANLVVTRDGSLEEEVQVAYITRPYEGYNPDSALEGDDYTDTSATPGVITFGANQTEATISLNILQDGLFENRERFEVVLQPPDGVAIAEGKGIRRVVILDFRGTNYRPVATLHRIGEQSVMEDAGSVEFAVRLTHAARQLLRYDISLDPGVVGARAGADFVDPTMTVSVPAGQMEQTFTVALIDDNDAEDSEDFRIRMTGHIRNPNPSWATLATPTTARVTITDDDLVEPIEVRLAVTIRRVITEATSQRDITVAASFHTEAPAGTARVFVPYTEDTTVSVQFDPDSSAAANDFQAFGVLDVVIPAGQTRGTSTLEFRPVDDDIDEDNERVILAGSVVANSFVDSSLPVVPVSFVFVDNDTRGITVTPGFTMSLMEEGDSGSYTVVLGSQPTDTVTIELQLDDNGQLNVSTTTLTFDADNWNVPQPVTVWAEDDGIIEVNPSESIEHEVSGGDYDQFALGTVVVSITDTTVAYMHLEGARVLESSGNLEFTVRVSPPEPTLAVTVQYSTADGTATGGSDYTSSSASTLSIAAGQSSATIAIPITNDTLDEADVETFTLRLTSPTAATLVGGVTELTATGSIVDDDDTPVLTISGPDGAISYVEEDTSLPVTFTLSLSGGSSEAVTLNYATGLATGDISARSGLGRATAGDDYIAASGVVTFASGELTKTITVQVQDDDISEGTEFFGLNLSSLTNAEFTNQQTKENASVGIRDNDTRGVLISRSQIVLEEPIEGATAIADSYTVVLTSQPTATATVTIGGASDPAVSLGKSSLTFTALNWNTSQTVTITPVRDDDADDEFVTVTHILSGGDYEGLRGADVGVRVNDSNSRDVIVSEPTLALSEGSNITYTVELASQPTATTTVSITITGDAQLTIDPTELTFTTSDWNTPQTITVTATQDEGSSDNTATLNHVASGSDYVSVTKAVTVTVTDDDDPLVTVSFGAGAYTVREGETQAVTVRLSADPERTVVIPLTATNQGTTSPTDYSVPLSVTFNDGETEQTVTFTAAQDTDDYDESVLLAIGMSLPTRVSASGTVETTVSIIDDEEPPVTVMFGADAYTVPEGGMVTVTVTLNRDPKRTVVIPLVTTNQGGADFTLPTSVTFNAGETEQTITFGAGTDPGGNRPGASVLIGFATDLPAGVSAGTPATTLVSITDANDPQVTVSFGAGAYTVPEGGTQAVTVRLSADPERTVVIPLTATNQGGASAADYSVPLSVTFNTGELSKTTTFTATQDTDVDAGESVLLAIATRLPAGVSASGTVETTVTITDDDPQVTVSFGAGAYTVPEGGTQAVTVRLSADPERTVVIPLTATNQGGASPADYSVPLSVTFNTGELSKTITFTAAQDADDDDGESVLLGFGTSLPVGVSASGTVETTVTITDDDDPQVTVSFGAGAYTVPEGGTQAVTVRLSADPERTVVIPLTATNQGGASPADYSVPLSVTFNTGELSKTITFTAAQDADDDDGESVLLGFGTSLPVGVSASGTVETTVTITDDDDPQVTVSFGAGAYTVPEGGTQTVTVRLSADPERTVVIPLTATDQGNASPADYSGVPQRVSISAGQMSASFTFTATQDMDDDDGESVLLAFDTSLPAGVSASGTVETTVTITDDDDPQVTVSFGAGAYTVPEGGTQAVTVRLSADPERTVVIPLTATNQGGASPADYSVPLSVTFNTGELSNTVTFTAATDMDDDDDESVLLGFDTSLPAGVSASGTVETTVTITDDDDPAVTVSFGAGTYTVREGGTQAVTVRLSADPERTVVIPLTATNQGTTSSTDYSVPLSVTFNTGELSKTTTFTAAQDTDDDDESVLLGFDTSLPAGVSASGTVETTVTITDDEEPPVTVMFGADAYTVPEGGMVTVTVTLSRDPKRTVVIPLVTTNQGGAAFTLPRSVTFNAGETEQAITFGAGTDPGGNRPGASVLIGFATNLPAEVSAGTPATTLVSITDANDPQVTVSFGADAYTVPEGGTQAVTVRLSADPERTVVIPLTATNQGNASAADYSVPLSVTFNTGELSKTTTFTATQDTDDDDGESVLLAIATRLPAGVSAGATDETVVSITDDDPQVTVSFGAGAYTVPEGGTQAVTVRLSADPERTVVIPLTATEQGTTSSTDYSVPLSVTFNDGELSKTITFTATQDPDDDDGESVLLGFGTSLPAGVSASGTVASTVTITDDDDPAVTVSFGAGAYTVPEGGTQAVTVRLSADPERTVVIPLTATEQGTTSSTDYSVPLSVTFNDGELSKTITFTATQDPDDDDGESVLLAFGTSLPAGVSASGTVETTVTITDDDDPQVTVSFGAGAYTVPEGGTQAVTVRLSADPERTVVIPLTATDQGTTSSADYSVPLSVTFNTGELSKTVTFTAATDMDDDDGESVLLGFDTSLPAGVSASGTVETTVTITDDDDPQVTVSFGAGAYTVPEGGTQAVTVRLSADPERTVVIPLTATDQGTTSSGDYSVPLSVTFNTGELSKTITFTAAQDPDDDDGESVLLGFGTSLPVGVSASGTVESTVTITDDDDPAVTVSFGAGAYTVPEGGTQAVTVRLSADPERTVVIPLTATNQGGASPADYSVPLSVTFNTGELSKAITFTATQDADDDDGESVLLAFDTSLPAGVSASGTVETTVTITDDDDPAVTVSFGAGAYTVPEGGTQAVTVRLSADPERTVVIPLTATEQGTTSSTDYSVPLSVTFNDGDTSQTITFTAAQDPDDDDGESVLLGFGTSLPAGVSASGTVESTVTITDDDDPAVTVSFGAGAYTVPEGGTQAVTVRLSADPERTVVIPLTATEQGTTSSTDYSVPLSVTFNDGELSKTITFTATQDPDDDDGESVLLAFGTSLPAGVSASGTVASTVTITDDDDPAVTVSFGAGAYTVPEGGTQAVTVRLSADPERTVVIPLTATDQGTTSSADYSVPLSVTFNDGELSKTITFTATQDPDDDDGESVLLGFGTSLPAGVSAGATAETTVTITDDDDPQVTVSFGAGAYTVPEGGTQAVTVGLSADPERTVVIPLTATNQGGASSTDYSVPLSVTFHTGELSKTITFTATQDADDDDGESVLLAFGTSLPAGVSASGTVASTVTITDDDDPQVTVSFGANAYTVPEGGTRAVTVRLSADPERTVVIPLTATDQGTTSSTDYSVPLSVTFNTGERSKTITFTATQDADDDDGESVLLAFGTSLPAGVSASGTVASTVTITDDDDPQVTVSFGANAYTVPEGGTRAVTVRLSADPERTVVIPLTATEQGTTSSTDYSVPLSVTFNTGELSKTITFTATQDADADDGESVLLAFGTSLPAGVSAGATAETTVTITDDQRRNPGDNVGGTGTVVTIVRVPDGTVIPDHSSLWVGETVEDGSTFVEGTRALFRLEFEAVGGGPSPGGVDVDLSFDWQNVSPLVNGHGQVGKATFSMPRVDVWDTSVQIRDNDVGQPDETMTIRITGCRRSGCIIGTPSAVTLNIVDDDGGPAASIPGPPNRPRVVCAPSDDGYDDTGIAVSWKAPNFVGGAPVRTYELRYRESTRFIGGRLIEHPWVSWPHGAAATSATITGLMTGTVYTVQVQAVNANGPGRWSEGNRSKVGPMHEICEIIDLLTP